MNRTTVILVALAAVFVLGTGAYAAYTLTQPAPVVVSPTPLEAASTTPETPSPSTPAPSGGIRAFGNATLAVGEKAVFKDLTLRVLELESDSRCPQSEKIQCLWAGTVTVKLEVVTASGSSIHTVHHGSGAIVEGYSIVFESVSPRRGADTEIPPSQYRFTFSVTPPGCYVAGCSSHLCSDRPDVVTTCEFRAEYACYQGARCERQASGACGWTQTPELKACLASPPAL